MFIPNVGFLFTEFPLEQRFNIAKDFGFNTVECPSPYGITIEKLKQILKDNSIHIELINTPVGDPSNSEFGFAGIPGETDQFDKDWKLAFEYASQLDVKKIHVTAGILHKHENRTTALTTFANNIKRIAKEASSKNITLLLEPINQRNMPNYLISNIDEVVDIIHGIAEDNVKLMFDVYHAQVTHGDIVTKIEKFADVIGHVQIASVPSRNEPDDEELNYNYILNAFRLNGYNGPFGLEYRPKTNTLEGLKWMDNFNSF